MLNKSLAIQQLDIKLRQLTPLQQLAIPPSGWIKAIRTAIGMSQAQLGRKLSVTRQSVKETETREKNGSITLNSLRETANALDMHLVYGFLPKDISLDALIEKKAAELAARIVLRASQTMRLEDQENSSERIQKAILEKTQSIKNEMPKILWD